jgi:hypothetical protein
VGAGRGSPCRSRRRCSGPFGRVRAFERHGDRRSALPPGLDRRGRGRGPSRPRCAVRSGGHGGFPGGTPRLARGARARGAHERDADHRADARRPSGRRGGGGGGARWGPGPFSGPDRDRRRGRGTVRPAAPALRCPRGRRPLGHRTPRGIVRRGGGLAAAGGPAVPPPCGIRPPARSHSGGALSGQYAGRDRRPGSFGRTGGRCGASGCGIGIAGDPRWTERADGSGRFVTRHGSPRRGGLRTPRGASARAGRI